MPLPYTIPTLADRCTSVLAPNVCGLPNDFDNCAQGSAVSWKRIYRDPNFAKLTLPVRYWNLNEPPYAVMPPDAIRLNQMGTAQLDSLTADTQNIIFQYRVPFGFEGIINEQVNLFAPQTGPVFQDGSGALTWRIYLNQYLLTYYNNITTSLGSLTASGSVWMGGGIRIRSNQTVTYYVIPTAAALAGGLDPAGQVICGIRGWIYPVH